MSREYIIKTLLINNFYVDPSTLKAVSIPSGIKEADIIFKSEKAYHTFWGYYTQVLKKNEFLLQDFEECPIFRGEIMVMTVYIRSSYVPMKDVVRHLGREWWTLRKNR